MYTGSDNNKIIIRLLKIWPHFRPAKNALLVTILATTIAAFTEPLIPALLKPLLDHGFKKGTFNIWVVPVTLLLLFGIRGLAGFIAQYFLATFTNAGLLQLRGRMFQKVLCAELSLFRSQSSSALTNTLVYEVSSGSTMLVNSLLGLIKDTFTLVALISYLLYLNWKLTLIVALLFPAVAFVMHSLSTRLYRLTKASQSATDNLAYVVEENVLAHRDIRLHAAQTVQQARFLAFSESLRRLSIKSAVASAAMTPITQMLAAVALSAVISIALVQSESSNNSVGSFVAFVTAMLMLVAPIKHLSEVASPITRGLAAIERGLDLIENTPSEKEGSFEKPRASGYIQFKDVTVSFSPDVAPAIDKFTFSIEPGETVALVGASGAGKTTLVNLLPRFIEATSGTVELDGYPLGHWTLDSLRSQFGVVSQNVIMLNNSIASNIALGQPIDRARLLECVKAANLDKLISELPLGLDTEVGHNAMQLSGGQRQRLAIARALYKNAPVLILDEATSALDSESESAVQEALERLMLNRTTLVIAHRLSTIHNADRIVVMASGKIVETGNHAELMKHDGQYSRLYRLGFSTDTPTDLDLSAIPPHHGHPSPSTS